MAGLEYLQSDGDRLLVVCTEKKAYAYSSITGAFSSIQDGNDFTGDADVQICMDVGFNLLLITNYSDAVRKYSSAAIEVLGGMTDCEPGSVVVKCKVMRAYSDFLMALHTIEDGTPYPTRVRWSKKGQAEVWKNDASGSGQAGWVDLTDSPDPIMNGMKLNNFMAVYKERGIYLFSYVGVPAVFSIRGVIFNKGLYAVNSLISLGDVHFFLGGDNFYSFNGANLVPIGDAIKYDFFSDLYPAYRARIQAIHNERDGEIWWAYPSKASSGELDKILVYAYGTGAWYYIELSTTAWFSILQLVDVAWHTFPDTTWDDAVGLWDDTDLLANYRLMLCSNADTNIMQITQDPTRTAGAYTRTITSKCYDFKLPGILKRVRRIQFAFDSGTTVYPSIYVGTTDDVNDAVVWNGPYVIDTSRGVPRIDVDLTAVLFSFKFESVGVADAWHLTRLTPWFIQKGIR